MGVMDILLPLILLGGVYWLHTTGQLQPFLQNIIPKPPQVAPAPAPAAAPTPGPAPRPQTTAPAPSPAPPATGGGGSSVTGKTIYPVVAEIPNTGDVTIRGGGNSFRDNIGYPCNKCSREATWIFKPGTGGDWSPKLGSHGSEGGKETLIELGNIQINGTGGDWRCEGPHMTYNDVTGGTGSAPKIGGLSKVGIKAVTWPLPGNKVHHELWWDETGTGNNWKKFAEFSGAATGCNAITCPIPGSKCQDTMRLDNPSGHQFIARSMHEIKPGGSVGGGAPAAAAAIMAPRRTTRIAPVQAENPHVPPIAQVFPNDRIYINVKINGRSYRLLYDTAATITYVNSAQLGTPVGTAGSLTMSSPRDPLYNVTMQVGNGRPFQTKIAVGNAQVLSRSDLLKSGYVPVISGNQTRLLPRGSSVIPTGARSIPLRYTGTGRSANLPTIIIKINGIPLTARIDTGTPRSRITKADAVKVGLKATQTISGIGFGDATIQIGDGPIFRSTLRIDDRFAVYGTIIGLRELKMSGYTQVWGDRPQLVIGAAMTAPIPAGGYECFDQREDNILVHCCRYKTKPPEEPHCKSTLETGEYLKCCRDDKKPWGGLW